MTNSKPTEIKIANIGGDSLGWAPKILADLALCDQLTDPLCAISVDDAWAMFNEMPAANQTMLPGWEID